MNRSAILIQRMFLRRFSGLLSLLMILAGAASPLVSVFAQPLTVPFSILQAVVLVVCDDRQGSGTIVNGDAGYVLTNAHVVINKDTKAVAAQCYVGLLDDPLQPPRIFYHVVAERWSFVPNKGQDFALLKITDPVDPEHKVTRPLPEIKTNEFAQTKDVVQVFGFSDSGDHVSIRSGHIQGFSGGFIQTDIHVSPGDSGGATLDENLHLVGIPTRIVTIRAADGTQEVRYELVDIRSVMNWLDTQAPNLDDQYFHHADAARYHQQAVYVHQADLGCDQLVRTPLESTIYCLLPGNQRLIFPNAATFLSWFPNFGNVQLVDPTGLSSFAILRNVTYKPGTLVKSLTSPKTYLVVDLFGTLRWIPAEQRAKDLWGSNWASLVHDIPDEFWVNYSLGQPLD